MRPVDYALIVKDLWAGYEDDNPVIRAINLEVKPSTFLGIIGPNGAGKSTLFKAILGVIPLVRGEILVFGRPITQQKHLIGYVPQYLNIERFLPITVEELVGFGLIHNPWQKISKEDKQRIYSTLELLGISGLASHRYNRLSVGQQQRVLIARALVKRPKILFLDEPTASLDEPSEENIFYLLQKLKQEGMTIIMVSHDIGVLSQFVDEVACLNRRLIYHGKGGQALGKAIEQAYKCPVDLIAHGTPHRVLRRH